MASEFGAVMLCGSAVTVNLVYDIRKSIDPFQPLLAGLVFTGVCVVLAQWEPALGTALAGVFFLSVFLTRGEEIIKVLEDISNAA